MDVQKFIGTSLRIKISDGRSLDGILAVVDPFGNMLMSNVHETSQDKINPDKTHTRELGLVSVPRNQIEKILLEKKHSFVLEDKESRQAQLSEALSESLHVSGEQSS